MGGLRVMTKEVQVGAWTAGLSPVLLNPFMTRAPALTL